MLRCILPFEPYFFTIFLGIFLFFFSRQLIFDGRVGYYSCVPTFLSSDGPQSVDLLNPGWTNLDLVATDAVGPLDFEEEEHGASLH